MALIKELPTAFGASITANYHRIAKLDVDYNQKHIAGIMASYADAETREAGHNPLVQSAFEWAGEEWNFPDGEPTRMAVYHKIKKGLQ